MRGQNMRFQVTAVSLACIAMLSACGGGGDGGTAGNKAQSIDFPFPGARAVATPPAPLKATASSGLSVTFTSNTPAICTVSDGMLVPVKPGECSVTATQPGDSTYVSASAQQLFKVVKQTQKITFVSPGFQQIDAAPAPLAATSDSGLAVSFASTTPDVCTVSGTTLTLVSRGSCAITAMQEGNDNYEVAPPQSVQFVVGDAPPPVLTFLSGFQSTGLTIEGGAVGTFAGSNKDGWWCSDANWCSSSLLGDGSFKFSYVIQPRDPAHPNTDTWMSGYAGFEIFAPGITDFDKTANMTTGVKVDKQTTLKFNVSQNPEWFGTPGNPLKVSLILGHFNMKGGTNPCNVSLNTVLTPSSASPTNYELQLSSFNAIGESCDLPALVPATELATYPIVRIKIESTAVNTSVLSTPEPNPSYRTELTLTGPITVQ